MYFINKKGQQLFKDDEATYIICTGSIRFIVSAIYSKYSMLRWCSYLTPDAIIYQISKGLKFIWYNFIKCYRRSILITVPLTPHVPRTLGVAVQAYEVLSSQCTVLLSQQSPTKLSPPFSPRRPPSRGQSLPRVLQLTEGGLAASA